ncbi:hypothetical protein V1517DRAFT_323940 [Lipomyces orientalis]|uniref:Uncharacterized protein n=1 Tax=Lipomyces orientalis TaxID=1233043 RepID=A0ACC3TN06_9ASCO
MFASSAIILINHLVMSFMSYACCHSLHLCLKSLNLFALLFIFNPVFPLHCYLGDVGKVVVPIIRKRWIKTILIGAGVAAFTTIATGATAFTVASCKASLAAAAIGGPIWPATSLACRGSAIASGLYTYGSSQSWVFESYRASIGNCAMNGGLYYAITGHYIQHQAVDNR